MTNKSNLPYFIRIKTRSNDSKAIHPPLESNARRTHSFRARSLEQY
jgi:hypothetical protein